MDRWHGKHPIPWDFFNSFNDIVGPQSELVLERRGTSATATSIWASAQSREAAIGYAVTIDNIGGMPRRSISCSRIATERARRIHETPAIWEHDQNIARRRRSRAKGYRIAQLDGASGWTPIDHTRPRMMGRRSLAASRIPA